MQRSAKINMTCHFVPMELINLSDEDECINAIALLEPPLIEENDGKKYYCMQI